MIYKLTPKDSEKVALIHKSALSDDFLPSLGIKFLNTFYSGLIGKPNVFGFVYQEKNKVAGFVVGTNDMNAFFKTALKSKFFKLSFLLLFQILKRPIIIKNILETFLYPQKDSGPKAELVVIAIDDKYRGMGIGKKLVRALESEMKKRKIKEYKLTVTKRNKNANDFYTHLGFKKFSEFSLYGKEWNVLVKRV